MRVPGLHKHATGQWFVKCLGKSHYLGTDHTRAVPEYLKLVSKWQQYHVDKKNIAERLRTFTHQVHELVHAFCKAKRIERTSSTERYYRKHLERFLGAFRDRLAASITALEVDEFKRNLIKRYGPRTVNHDLIAIKALFNWAGGLGIIPPLSLVGVKSLPLPPVAPVSATHEQVCTAIYNANDDLRPWVALNYLGLLRPTEVVKVIQGQYTVIEEGVFRLHQGKTDHQSAIGRHVLLSGEALAWLANTHKRWTALVTYEGNIRSSGFQFHAKVLQKAAAQHLVSNHGVHPADIEIALGHIRGRMPVTYYIPHWQRIRTLLSQLSLSFGPDEE